MTRALGHKHLAAHGVTPEPYTTSFQLSPRDACLVRLEGRREGVGPWICVCVWGGEGHALPGELEAGREPGVCWVW